VTLVESPGRLRSDEVDLLRRIAAESPSNAFVDAPRYPSVMQGWSRLAALPTLIGVLVTCGGKAVGEPTAQGSGETGGTSGAATTDAGPDAPNPAESLSAEVSAVECDHYFKARYSRCGGPVLPDGEKERVRLRFQQVCQNQSALPGSGVTRATLEACATAFDSFACDLPIGPPAASGLGEFDRSTRGHNENDTQGAAWRWPLT
jgi:hypothetical protein